MFLTGEMASMPDFMVAMRLETDLTTIIIM